MLTPSLTCLARPLQSFVARMYLATTWNNPPRWGTLWGGELHAEIQFVGTKISTECSLFPIKSLESANELQD